MILGCFQQKKKQEISIYRLRNITVQNKVTHIPELAETADALFVIENGKLAN